MPCDSENQGVVCDEKFGPNSCCNAFVGDCDVCNVVTTYTCNGTACIAHSTYTSDGHSQSLMACGACASVPTPTTPPGGPTATPGGPTPTTPPTGKQCTDCCDPNADPTCGGPIPPRPASLGPWDANCAERHLRDGVPNTDWICCLAPGSSANCRIAAPAKLDGGIILSTGGSVGQSTSTDGGSCSGTAECNPPPPGGPTDVGRCDNSATCDGYGCNPVFTGVNIAEGASNNPSWWCRSTIIRQGSCSVNAEGEDSWWFCKNPADANGLNFSFNNLTIGSRAFQVTGVPPGYTCNYTFWIDGVKDETKPGCTFTSPSLKANNYLIVVLVPLPPITCTVTLSPSSLTITQGETGPQVAVVTISDGSPANNSVSRINFSSNNASVTTVTPSQVSPPNYATTVSAISQGNATITGIVTLNNSNTCQDDTPVTVTSPGSWFQTWSGDVHAQNQIRSYIPSTILTNRYFNLNLGSDYSGPPGLISYGTDYDFWIDSLDQGTDRSSSKKWLANSSLSLAKTSYDDFYKKLGLPTTDNFSCDSGCPTPPSGQTTIYYSADNVSIDGNNQWDIPANTKVIVLANGDLNISLNQGKRITVPVGSFLAFIVKGNILIYGKVGDKTTGPFTGTSAHLQGIYITDGSVDTYYDKPSAGAGSGFRLVAGGLFSAKGGFNLKRDLKDDCTGICNANTPAELFIFRPDLVINAPYELWSSKIDWQEVVP